ncbi:hypothetical protein CHS0354_039116 [Potamilus streckersoni]|uniref:Uncharacterized protein n=1 Tax=Potamilus streckersoni TaxID=2493646 RepID=A0AAE0VND4_9BIVA|nr:hypothetical protein CHS0354_039116 [Potamilus streckersoni]
MKIFAPESYQETRLDGKRLKHKAATEETGGSQCETASEREGSRSHKPEGIKPVENILLVALTNDTNEKIVKEENRRRNKEEKVKDKEKKKTNLVRRYEIGGKE